MTARVDLKGVTIKKAALHDLSPLITLIQNYCRFGHLPFNRAAILSGLKMLLKHPILGQAWLIRNRNRSIGYIVASFGFKVHNRIPMSKRIR